MAEPVQIAQVISIDAARLQKSSIGTLPATTSRLTDSQLAVLEQVAAAPLPTLPPCDSRHFDQCLRIMIAALPRQNSDDTSAELFVAAYRRKLGHLPADAINFMTDQSLERCKWFPPISECLKIVEGWQRNDEAARQKAGAVGSVMQEKQLRMEEAMSAIQDGAITQAEIDALPPRWQSIAETRGLLRRLEDGSYVLRPAIIVEDEA